MGWESSTLTFMAGCLPRTSLREQLPAAALAGFKAITIWPNVWRHALTRDGLSLRDMRAMLDDHGLVLTDADGCRDWAPAAKDPSLFGPIKGDCERQEFFDVCAALGGTTIVAVHLTDVGLDIQREAESFARLCDDAGRYALRVGLEAVAFSAISDLATASRIVAMASRPNGGLVIDLWHHVRGAGQGDSNIIRDIPADRIFTVQLADGPTQPAEPLVEEAMFHRQFPGQGDMDASGFLRLLIEKGVEASYGPEVYQRGFERGDARTHARALADATKRAILSAQT